MSDLEYEAEDADERSPEEKFWDFHHENPGVYDLLCAFAREMKEAGHTKIGINLCYERARWHRMEISTDENDYRLNSIFAPFYARLIMHAEDDLKDFFTFVNRRRTGCYFRLLHDGGDS